MKVVDKHTDLAKVDFLAGSILLVNKPLDWTSFDVVNKIRYTISHKLGVKRIKVGHAGTLDPLATGLLILCTGKATKIIEQLQGQKKSYLFDMKVGATTETYDSEMEENAQFPWNHITEEMIKITIDDFVGEIDQVPPIYSALKKNGKALYKYARKGQTVDIPSRKVQIDAIDLLNYTPPLASLSVLCGKGTYIRSLAYDMGKAMDSGAYLKKLMRTKIGEYDLAYAWELVDFVKMLQEANMTNENGHIS